MHDAKLQHYITVLSTDLASKQFTKTKANPKGEHKQDPSFIDICAACLLYHQFNDMPDGGLNFWEREEISSLSTG